METDEVVTDDEVENDEVVIAEKVETDDSSYDSESECEDECEDEFSSNKRKRKDIYFLIKLKMEYPTTA